MNQHSVSIGLSTAYDTLSVYIEADTEATAFRGAAYVCESGQLNGFRICGLRFAQARRPGRCRLVLDVNNERGPWAISWHENQRMPPTTSDSVASRDRKRQ